MEEPKDFKFWVLLMLGLIMVASFVAAGSLVQIASSLDQVEADVCAERHGEINC